MPASSTPSDLPQVADGVLGPPAVLPHCHEAMAPDGRVLVIETGLVPDHRLDFAAMRYLEMLVVLGGPTGASLLGGSCLPRQGCRWPPCGPDVRELADGGVSTML